jgi:hypothetical protein
MCYFRRAPFSIVFDKSTLTVNRKMKAQKFGTIFDFVPVLLMGAVSAVIFKLHTASDSSEALV